MEDIKLFIISNCPLATVRLYKYTAAIMIQQIGKKPYNAPCTPDHNDNPTGIRYKRTATSRAMIMVSRLAIYPFIFFIINAQKMNIIGIKAANADRAMLLKGLTSWVQVIIAFSDFYVSKKQTTFYTVFKFSL